MISNVEEALLLLQKWKTDSSRVVALIGRASMCVRFEGTVDVIRDEGSFSIAGTGQSFMYVSLSECKINYEATAELVEMLKEHLPENLEDSIHLEFPEGGGVSLFGSSTQHNSATSD